MQDKLIYDPHVHASPNSENLDVCVDTALNFLQVNMLAGVNILVIRNAMFGMGHDALYLYLKLLYPEKFSVYGGLQAGLPGISRDAQSFAEQVRQMRDVGFDGVKIWINGSTRDSWGFELDDAVLDPMWSYLEQTQFPLLIHVGNTEHWPPNSPAALEKRRSTQINESSNEPLYARLERVLERHPNMNITIAHFLFMCEQKERLAALMERYPSLKLDICPGTAMYYYMSQHLDFWRDFFLRYQDRLLFGTDNHVEQPGGLEQIRQVRRFLETDETAPVEFFGRKDWSFDYTGIGPLDDAILKKLYWTNFERVRGSVRPVHVENAIAYLEQELLQMEQMDERTASKTSRSITRQVLARMKEKSYEADLGTR